jgi:hypothetical protein
MDALRIRVELNRGGQGMAFGRFVEVARETIRFLEAFARDAGLGGSPDLT